MSSVKKELLNGVFYTAIAKYSGLVVQLVITAILARLLTPKDFGVVAIATVFITFFNILTDVGIGPAIIQNKELTDKDLNHIFSLTLYIGILFSLFFFLSSWLIASYYNNEQLINVCQLLSISILAYSLSIVPNGLLLCHKQFRFVAIRTLAVQLFSGICAVIAALSGLGIYSLLFNPIISSILLFILSYWKYPLRFSVYVEYRSIKKILSFSIYQFLFNFINYFSRNLDKILIGRYLGLAPLGYYEKSYRLMMLPLQNVTHVLTPAFQPVLSVFQNDYTELAKKFIKILTLLAYIAFPLSVILYFTSNELILLFFGDQWEDAVPVFRILSLSVFMQLLTSSTGAIYQSANATKQLFISGVFCAVFMISGFTLPIFLYGNMEAVAWGFLIAQLANSIQTFVLLFRTLRYPILEFYKILLKPVIVSIILFISLDMLSIMISDMSLLLSLMLKSMVWLVVLLISVQYCGVFDIITFLQKYNFKKEKM